MPEVVVAYAEADEDAATLVIKKLEKLGYKVTRDEAGPKLTFGAARRTKAQAAPVLLLWSRAFAKSNPPPKRPLATVRLDAALPPAMVRAPAIDLRAWRGRDDHRGWRKLLGALSPKGGSVRTAAAKPQLKTTVKAVGSMTTENEAPSGANQKSTRLDALIFVMFLALAGGGAYYALFLR